MKRSGNTRRHKKKSSDPENDELMNELKAMDPAEFSKEFESMLDDMNIHSKQQRDAIFSKDTDMKLHIMHQYRKNAESMIGPKHQNLQTPAEFSDVLRKTDLSPEYLLIFLQSLRVTLSTRPVSWTQEFAQESTVRIKSIMMASLSSIYSNQSTETKILHECVKCMKSIMDSQFGLTQVMNDAEFIEILVVCLVPAIPGLMADSIRLLAAMSLVNYSLTLRCLSQVARKNDHPRFSKVVEGLQMDKPLVLRVNSMLFINAFIAGTDEHKLRMFLRFELNRCGIVEAIKELKKIGSPAINVQLSAYEESKNEDMIENQFQLQSIEQYFSSPDEAFAILSKSLMNTPSDSYLLGIVICLLLIDGDIVRKKCYFQLCEEILTQVVLQKNGIDYDFGFKPFDLNIEPIIEGMANRTLVDEMNGRLEIIEKKYTIEATSKNELQAKLDISTKNFEIKLKSSEEQLEKATESIKGYEATIVKLKEEVNYLKSEKGIISSKNVVPATLDKFQEVLSLVPSSPMNDTPPSPPPCFDESGPPSPPPCFDEGGPPPPPPCFDEGGPPPPPPCGPPCPGGQVEKVVVPKKKKYHPPAATKRLNWSQINHNDISEKSLWKIIDETRFEQTILFDKIIELFSSKMKASAVAGLALPENVIAKKRVKEPIVLDSKTVQNLSIFLGGIKCSHDEFVKRILQFDEETITETTVENLLKFTPGLSERSQLLEYSGSLDELPEAEQFIFKLSPLSYLDHRLEYMLVMNRFSEQIGDIKPKISCVISACKEILSATKLHDTLQLILLCGNYMNAGTRNESTFGFNITFLANLADTKTQSGGTFMNFLSDMIETSYPELLGFDKDLTNIVSAVRVNEEQLNKNVTQISKNIAKIQSNLSKFEKPYNSDDKFGPLLNKFYIESSDQLILLEQMVENMSKMFDELLEFFCIKKPASYEEVFGIFCKFVDDFNKAQTENKVKAEKVERDRIIKEKKEKEVAKKKTAPQKKGTPFGKPKKDEIPAAAEKDGVIDGLLQALESGEAFNQNKGAPRRNKPPVDANILAARKRSMNLNARDVFSALLKQCKDDPTQQTEQSI